MVLERVRERSKPFGTQQIAIEGDVGVINVSPTATGGASPLTFQDHGRVTWKSIA